MITFLHSASVSPSMRWGERQTHLVCRLVKCSVEGRASGSVRDTQKVSVAAVVCRLFLKRQEAKVLVQPFGGQKPRG